MLVKIYEDNPSEKQVRKVAELLSGGGIAIYPTDSVYAIGCAINSSKAMEKIARYKGTDPSNPELSLLVSDLSQLADYTIIRDNRIFKLIKRNTPGPFTFVVHANSQIARMFRNRKKHVGIRIPSNRIVLHLIEELGLPLVTASIHDTDEIIEYTTDPELIYEKYCDLADIVIDGGYGNNTATTIVDCTGDEPEIIRQGIGELEY